MSHDSSVDVDDDDDASSGAASAEGGDLLVMDRMTH